jgi:hypothetical protein
VNLTASQAWVRETGSMVDDGCWKQVWAGMTDSELEDRTVHVFWLSLHTPNAHAGRMAQLMQEAERRGQLGIVEKAGGRAGRTPVAKAEA